MNPDSGMVGWTSPGGMTPNGYSGWVSGRPIGPALPRPYDTFLSGAFGPFTPIVPMPLDQPAEGGDGRPAPRRWQYPVGWNLPIGQPGTEGLTLASFATLRNLAQRYSTLWGMLNLRVKELVGMEWDIGPTSEAQDEAKSDKALAKDQSERAKKLVDWFKWHIDPNYTDGFQSWYTAALWDQFIMDAVAVHPLPTREKGKGPFNSGLAHWELLDSSSIRPLVDVRGGLPMPPAPAYQQYLFGVPRVDMLQVLAIGDADETEALMDAAGMSVDLDEMEPDGQYRADQLHYWRQTPWTNSPYGLSPVAAALLPIAIGIQRQSWLNDYWQEGSVPSVFVEAGPAYQTAQQQGQLQSSLNSLAGDVAWKHRILVLPPGSKASPQKDLSFSKEVDMVIMEYLYPVLQIQPQEIGQMPGGRSSGMMGGGAASQEMMTSVQRQRTAPDRKIWKARFDRLIQWDFKQADLEWRWVEFEEEEDAEKKAASEASDIAHGIRTIDQVIVDNGGDAWGLPLTSTPIYVIGTGILPLDPSVQAPAPIAPGGSGPGAPTGSSEEPVEPSGAPADGSDAKPAEGAPPEAPTGAVEQPRTAGKPQSGISTHPAPKPAPTTAPASGGAAPAGEREVEVKAVLADLAKWRIKYKDPKLPSIVHQYLLRSYPEKDVEWASDPDIEWEYEPHVDLSDVNWTRRPGGRDHDKEAEIAGTLADGASMDPVVLVEFQTAAYNRSGLTVADGFHRTGAADESGWKDVPAFVGRNVPDKYRPLVRGAMQDNSASVADQKKAALAELMVLRRYAKAGRDLTKFTPSALSLDDVLRFAGDAAAHGHYHAFLDAASVIAEQDLTGMSVEQAYKAARESIGKVEFFTDESGVHPIRGSGGSSEGSQGEGAGWDEWDKHLSDLKGDEQPELRDVVAAWQQTAFNEIRAAAAGKDEHYEYPRTTDEKMAYALMNAVENDSAAAPGGLWRGLAVDDATAARFAGLRVGKTMDLNLSSWTDQGAETASDYAAENEGKSLVVLETTGEPWGLKISDFVDDSSGEWVMDGRFAVSAKPYYDDGGALHVPLAQQSVFTSLGSMRGTH